MQSDCSEKSVHLFFSCRRVSTDTIDHESKVCRKFVQQMKCLKSCDMAFTVSTVLSGLIILMTRLTLFALLDSGFGILHFHYLTWCASLFFWQSFVFLPLSILDLLFAPREHTRNENDVAVCVCLLVKPYTCYSWDALPVNSRDSWRLWDDCCILIYQQLSFFFPCPTVQQCWQPCLTKCDNEMTKRPLLQA